MLTPFDNYLRWHVRGSYPEEQKKNWYSFNSNSSSNYALNSYQCIIKYLSFVWLNMTYFRSMFYVLLHTL